MITEEHLLHWLEEINYQLNGLRNELNKKEFAETKVITVNEQAFSFEYAREKADMILKYIQSTIPYDIKHDGENQNASKS